MNRDTLLAVLLFGVAGWVWWSKSSPAAAAAAAVSSPGVLSPSGPPQTTAQIPPGTPMITWGAGLELERQGFTRTITYEGLACWSQQIGQNTYVKACATISFDVVDPRQPFLEGGRQWPTM